MSISEIQAKSILRKHAKIDSWFITHYGINLYRGCAHNCVYCDGRAEAYRVEGDFGEDIAVKINALEILKKELDRSRRRKPMPDSFMVLGGGVCDAYQPLENTYRLARGVLELCLQYSYPVHVLTKSTLVENDIDLLKDIQAKTKALVCFSFSSTNQQISGVFEPGVPRPDERLAVMEKLRNAGIHCGIFLMPVIPFITDSDVMIRKTAQDAANAGAEFVIFGNMTLKDGRQKEHFMRILQKEYPGLVDLYAGLYNTNSRWGEPAYNYTEDVHNRFLQAAAECTLPVRIPPHIFDSVLHENDKIIVVLEHLDYILKLHHRKNSYRIAARSLSRADRSVKDLKENDLLEMPGIGPATVSIIRELLETGRCGCYDKLVYWK